MMLEISIQFRVDLLCLALGLRSSPRGTFRSVELGSFAEMKFFYLPEDVVYPIREY